MGDLTRHASIKMTEAMGAYISAESNWQTEIANSECATEDQEFLSSLATGLARMRNAEIAKQHGSILPCSTDDED